MAKSAKEFPVDTSPTKEVVVDSITRDAADEDCVFDLIEGLRGIEWANLGYEGPRKLCIS